MCISVLYMSSYETTSSDDSSSEESSSSGSEDEDEDKDKMVNVRERRKEEFRNNEAVDEDRDTEDLDQDKRQRQVLPVTLQCCTILTVDQFKSLLHQKENLRYFRCYVCKYLFFFFLKESRLFGDTNETSDLYYHIIKVSCIPNLTWVMRKSTKVLPFIISKTSSFHLEIILCHIISG